MSSGVLIIGAGDMGARHAAGWAAAGARVVAVCDADVKRAEAVAAPFSAEAHAAPDDVLGPRGGPRRLRLHPDLHPRALYGAGA